MIGRRRRERRIRKAMATFPNNESYPSEVAELLGWPPSRVWADMSRMASRQHGIRLVPGFRRYMGD